MKWRYLSQNTLVVLEPAKSENTGWERRGGEGRGMGFTIGALEAGAERQPQRRQGAKPQSPAQARLPCPLEWGPSGTLVPVLRP